MILHEIELSVTRAPASAHFYREILGLAARVSNDQLQVLDSGHPGLDLNLTAHRTDALSLSFLVDSLQPISDKLQQAGIPYDGPIRVHLGMEEISFRDPAGNRIAVHAHTPDSPEWLRARVPAT